MEFYVIYTALHSLCFIIPYFYYISNEYLEKNEKFANKLNCNLLFVFILTTLYMTGLIIIWLDIRYFKTMLLIVYVIIMYIVLINFRK